MTALSKKPAAIRVVLPFVFRHWLKQPGRTLVVVGSLLGATAADLFMPVFSGHLIDALTRGPSDSDARHAALVAFGAIVALGAASMVLRLAGLQVIVPFTLKIMSEVAQDAFMRVQRFSTDWHANSFAGSTVRKITRGMWALDLLNDTVLLALLPSLVVLIGSMVLLGVHWASLGGVIALGALVYVTMTVLFSTRYIAPAARVSNAWDTKVGGTLADALTCNAVVKSFGAEAREDARLGRVINRWRVRVRRTWLRYNTTAVAQLSLLLVLRASVIGGAVLLWMSGHASPGDVTYVLTSYYVIHAYLRDVGMHINNLQRSVNDMEELVAIHDEPIGIADATDARPIAIESGEIVFDGVTFHYGGHRAPLYDGLSVTIRAGERVGLVGRSGSGKTTLVKLVQRLLRRHRWSRADRRAGHRAGHAAIAPQPDRDRAAGPDPVSPLARREHRLWPARGQRGGDRAGGEAGECARLHPAPAEGLRHACRRARRQTLGRRAAARGAGARVPGGRAGADPGRGDIKPRFGIGGADPASDGAADEGPDLDRDRAPAVDGAEHGSDPGVRPRRDRRARHACQARGQARRHLSRPVRAPGGGARTSRSSGMNDARPADEDPEAASSKVG
ncbi:hypothetical protein ACVWW5_002408 [Bradyrhizobium sp. LM3.4]